MNYSRRVHVKEYVTLCHIDVLGVFFTMELSPGIRYIRLKRINLLKGLIFLSGVGNKTKNIYSKISFLKASLRVFIDNLDKSNYPGEIF